MLRKDEDEVRKKECAIESETNDAPSFFFLFREREREKKRGRERDEEEGETRNRKKGFLLA